MMRVLACRVVAWRGVACLSSSVCVCVVYNIDRPRHRQTNKQRKCVGDNDMMIEINPSEKEKSINDHFTITSIVFLNQKKKVQGAQQVIIPAIRGSKYLH